MTDSWWWLGALFAGPAAVTAGSFLGVELERLRALTVAAAAWMTVVALGVAWQPDMRAVLLHSAALAWTAGGEALLRVDALSAALLPFAAGLWLLTVAVTPQAALDRGGLRRTAVATALTALSFLTESALVLLACWAASIRTFVAALSDPAHAVQRRVVVVYLGAATVVLAVGVVLLVGPQAGHPVAATVGTWLVALAALVRMGVVPFHAWVPEVFDHGRLGPAILFSAPQLGAYAIVVLLLPGASPALLRCLALLGLGTAMYGAALALVQTSARRACGYLFVSQSALVVAGLDCTSTPALGGGLLVWISAGLGFAGLARCVLVLEARRGRLDLSRFHGGYDRMPLLAATFLAMGLACTGFPGTIGFVGETLLVNGAVDVFPVMGFAVVFASALTGLAVLRMYFALFAGRPGRTEAALPGLGLRGREAVTFAGLILVIVGLGLQPRPLVDSRLEASEAILARRQAHAGGNGASRASPAKRAGAPVTHRGAGSHGAGHGTRAAGSEIP